MHFQAIGKLFSFETIAKEMLLNQETITKVLHHFLLFGDISLEVLQS